LRSSTSSSNRSHAGQPAAVYELRASPANASEVEVKLWSRGAYEDEDRTLVQLAITSNAPITLDAG
jgi:hypothetical protein